MGTYTWWAMFIQVANALYRSWTPFLAWKANLLTNNHRAWWRGSCRGHDISATWLLLKVRIITERNSLFCGLFLLDKASENLLKAPNITTESRASESISVISTASQLRVKMSRTSLGSGNTAAPLLLGRVGLRCCGPCVCRHGRKAAHAGGAGGGKKK